MKKSIVVIIGLIFGFNSFGQSNSIKELKKNINQVFESYVHYNRFTGNVLISQNNKIIYKKSFGYANIENHKKNTKNSIFNIASVTKPLTAVGIMKLVDAGKLSLETSINTFFPNFIPDFSKDITIRHLLNHSSGMQANIGRIDDEGNGLMPGKNTIALNDLLKIFKDSKLKFKPGKGYEYNNFGYSLLAYIIEKVSGQTYAEYMKQAVFTPANMKNTTADNFKFIRKRAFPHTGLGMNEFKKFSYPLLFSWVIGAGNIQSTTGDLYKFMEALENGKLLKPASVEKLYSYTQSRGVNNSKYGLGWRIESKRNEKWINHTGLLPGFTSLIGSLPKRNIKIIILSNATTTNLNTESTFAGKSQFVDGKIIDNVIAVLQGEKPKLLPLPVTTYRKKNADYSRTYALDAIHSLQLTKQGNEYSLKSIGKESWSVFTYQFSKNAKENNKASETALFFANAMSSQNFKGLSEYANNDMKGFFGSKEGMQQLKNIWANFNKKGGKFKSYNIYKVAGESDKTVHIRFHFKKNDIGLVLGINSVNQIQGMFKDNAVKTCPIQKVKLIAINEHEFFINGHQHNGMQDLKIKIANEELILIDGNTSFKATLLPSL
ncbi:serine hydrolase domain-containing protein [uncultured Tenacibaculum sp.]|uniref:serine hydrolase domain-containing protein n=1 Tax=uncultured Tenacibaculum sp. TaxID=174713 RepID=UPI00260A91EF|nr:serine hydrolase domain-containing protein [uncultured Tenacibaculum sp.]